MLVGTVLSKNSILAAVATSPVISSLAMIVSCVSVPVVSLISTQMSETHLIKVFGESKEV